MDEEAETFPKPETFPSQEDSVVREGGDPGSLQSKPAVMDEEVPKE